MKEIVDYIKNILRKRSVADEFKAELIESITGRLNNLNLLDDVAFAKMVVSQRTNAKNPKGPLAIKAELFKKGISRDIVSSLTFQTPLTSQTLQKIALDKLASYQKKDQKSGRQKTLRYLVGRGFSFESVIAAIDSVASKKYNSGKDFD